MNGRKVRRQESLGVRLEADDYKTCEDSCDVDTEILRREGLGVTKLVTLVSGPLYA